MDQGLDLAPKTMRVVRSRRDGVFEPGGEERESRVNPLPPPKVCLRGSLMM